MFAFGTLCRSDIMVATVLGSSPVALHTPWDRRPACLPPQLPKQAYGRDARATSYPVGQASRLSPQSGCGQDIDPHEHVVRERAGNHEDVPDLMEAKAAGHGIGALGGKNHRPE
jgi:hypothetical protein